MMTRTQVQLLRRSGQHFAVQLAIVFPLCFEFDIVSSVKVEFSPEIDEHIMSVQFPKGRKEGAAFGPAVLHLVTEPDLVVAGIADPGGAGRHRGAGLRLSRVAVEYDIEDDHYDCQQDPKHANFSRRPSCDDRR